MVSDGVRKGKVQRRCQKEYKNVSDGVSRVSDGVREVSDVVRKGEICKYLYNWSGRDMKKCIFAGPKRSRPTPGFSIFIRPFVRLYLCPSP